MAKKYTLERFDSGMHYIMLDKATVQKFTRNGNKRVLCIINDEVELHAAIMPKKEGGSFINIGSATCKKLRIKAGSVIHASFKEDQTEHQFDLPEEFKEVLDSDPTAKKKFDQLTSGNQRGLIYLVTLVKSTDKRIERSLKIAEKIKRGVVSPRKVMK